MHQVHTSFDLATHEDHGVPHGWRTKTKVTRVTMCSPTSGQAPSDCGDVSHVLHGSVKHVSLTASDCGDVSRVAPWASAGHREP